MDSTCPKCGGLIAEPFKAYGWAGKFCHCHDARIVDGEKFVPSREELDQLRKEVSELRARLAKLEDQHPRVVGPAVAGLPRRQFTPPQWVEPGYFPPVTMRVW